MGPDEHSPRPSTPRLLEASQRASSFNSKEGGVKESEGRGMGKTGLEDGGAGQTGLATVNVKLARTRTRG